MIETAGVALATLVATIGPLDVAAIFAALTAGATPQQRRSMAIRGSVMAAVILVSFALVGELLLARSRPETDEIEWCPGLIELFFEACCVRFQVFCTWFAGSGRLGCFDGVLRGWCSVSPAVLGVNRTVCDALFQLMRCLAVTRRLLVITLAQA